MKRTIFRHAYFLFCVLVTLPLVNPVPADAGWSNLGLYGGQVYSIALDKNNPNKMFAGTYYGGGLFRTDDAGVNWTHVTTGAEGTGFDGEATFSNTAVWGVQIAPSDSSVVWAVHNYWAEKSTDGGTTWTHILNSTMQGSQFRFCKSLAIDPANPNIVYVGTAGPWTDTLAIGTIYKTTDGGTTWTNVGPNTYTTGYGTFNNQFPYPVIAIDIDPQNSNNIYAVSASAEGAGATSYVYRSTNGGSTWTRIGNNPFTGGLKSIKVKPDDSSIVFVAGYNGIGKFACTTTCTYDSTTYNSSGSDIRALVFQPGSSGTLWVAGRGSYLGIYDISGNSFNWMDIGYQFLALAIKPMTNPYPGARVYGGELHRGIIYGSERLIIGGDPTWSWSQRNNGVNAIQVRGVAVDPNASDHYLAATEAGLYERASGGTTWTKRGNFSFTSAYSVAFDPTSSSTYYVGTEGAVYKTTDGGVTWPSSVAVSGYVTNIAVAPSGSSHLYVTTRHTSYTSYGSVYRITKDLSSATAIKPAGNFDYNAVAVDTNDAGYDRVFVGGGNYFGTSVLGKIYETTNATAATPTWTERLSSAIVNALLIDPNDSNKLYAGVGPAGGTEIPLYKSTDSGASWQKAYEGIPGGPIRYGVWGTSASNVYVLRHTGSIPRGGTDDSYMIRHDGSAWAKVGIGTSKPLYGIWGYDASNIFAVGESGTVVRYNGTSGSASQQGSADLHDVWGSSATNVFAVGKAGTIQRFNGSAWSAMTVPTGEDLRGIWGNSASNIFAVGSAGVILRYNGSNWSQMTRPVTETLEDVWGSSASNVFAVGSPRRVGSTRYYTVVRWNGSVWSMMTTPEVPAGKSGKLRSVWGSSGSDVFAVGDDGIVLRYNGSAWTAMTSGTSDALYGVWGISSTNVYGVGMFGTILRYNGTNWSPVDPSVNISDDKSPIWNAVTALAFSPEGHIYAATERQGVYASANEAKTWINLSAPPYSLYAVAAGSVISGGSAGGYSLSGEGLLYGSVTNTGLGTDLYDARVNTDIQGGRSTTTDTDGLWAMFHPGGTFNVTASKAGFTLQTEFNVPVYGGTWTQVTFGLGPAVAGPSTVIGAPSIPLTRAGTVTYTVTYTEADAVFLTNAHITLNATGSASGIVEVSGTGNVRIVIVSAITGNGTLGISVVAGSAYDHSGVPFPATGPSATFTVDNTAPTIAIGAPSSTLTKAGPVTYTVTYTGADSITLANANVTLNKTGTADGTAAVTGTGTGTRTVTISGITGNGTLGISIAAGTASDTAGNLAPAAGPSATFTVDNTAPTVGIGAPSSTLTKSGPVTYTVTYTGADSVTLANANVTLNRTGTANGTVAVTGTGSLTRTVTISGITGNGTLGISIAAGTAADTAGNLAPTAGPSATFTVDNTAPTVGIGAPSSTLTKSGPVTYTVTYTGADSVTLANANVTLNKTGTADGTAAVTGTGTVTISGITGNGTLGISIAAGTASDTAGNLAPAAGPSATFTVDNTAPTVGIGAPSSTLTKAGPVTYTVTYTGADSVTLANANVTLNRTGTANGTAAVTGSGSLTRTVTISGITGNGTLGISIAAGTASDTAGNLAPTAGPSVTFTVDNTAPTIAIGAPSTTLTRSGPVTYTVTYTGADSVTLANANMTPNKTGTANGTAAVTGSGSLTRTVTISGITGDGTLGISIAAGTASDTAGNLAPAAGPSATFTVDNTAPNAPTVSGPASTSNRKPTWIWMTGGGNGTYRYKLGNSDLTSDATETTATSFTLGTDLSLGLHTLYVQERDAAGNWSSSGSFAIRIVTQGDLDGSGTIDLRDAILVLKMISALPPGADIYSGADVDGDERIGTAEIIYILQRIAQLRD